MSPEMKKDQIDDSKEEETSDKVGRRHSKDGQKEGVVVFSKDRPDESKESVSRDDKKDERPTVDDVVVEMKHSHTMDVVADKSSKDSDKIKDVERYPETDKNKDTQRSKEGAEKSTENSIKSLPPLRERDTTHIGRGGGQLAAGRMNVKRALPLPSTTTPEEDVVLPQNVPGTTIVLDGADPIVEADLVDQRITRILPTQSYAADPIVVTE
ncbi:hypothetical protein BGZ65_002833 [Modicella reniformis]|uniref:Uncharacterized protein n=1 Tax=Modicella reniformis TaxID=1440133 RepID=A0A9P6MIR7_9FUNG|nr:hypothetical protein BGZ65_002833 [Modicella reniformis]